VHTELPVPEQWSVPTLEGRRVASSDQHRVLRDGLAVAWVLQEMSNAADATRGDSAVVVHPPTWRAARHPPTCRTARHAKRLHAKRPNTRRRLGWSPSLLGPIGARGFEVVLHLRRWCKKCTRQSTPPAVVRLHASRHGTPHGTNSEFEHGHKGVRCEV
jgi:hypothetical protein